MKTTAGYTTNNVEKGIFLGFAFFSLFGILRHEMWRDELQAWMLARDSTSIFHLIQNMHHEGHPALWHFCLYGLNQITHNPLIMQIFHWGISLGIVYLIVKYSPFLIIHKFLLSFSYFIFYEYGVISRNYALAIFFAFLFCVFYRRFKKQRFLLTLPLVLMANTNAYAFLISIALAFFMVLETSEKNLQSRYIKISKISFSAGFLCIGWLVAAWQIARVNLPTLVSQLPVEQIEITSTSQLSATIGVISPSWVGHTVRQLGIAIVSIWESYVPVPILFRVNFWGQNILSENIFLDSFFKVILAHAIALVLSIILFFLSVRMFSRKPAVARTYLWGTLALVFFQTFIHQEAKLRHDGHFFIIFILCAWLYIDSHYLGHKDRVLFSLRHKKSLLSVFLSVLLSVQAVTGIYAMALDYAYPFSSGKAVAEFIKENNLVDSVILGDNYSQTSVISGYLDVPIYYSDFQGFGTFWTFTPKKAGDRASLMQAIDTKVDVDQHRTLVLVLTQPLTTAEFSSIKSKRIQIDQLAEFEQPIVTSERFYLYLARRSA